MPRNARHIGHLTSDRKDTQWRRPIRKKTAAELLYRNDDREIELSQEHRARLIEIAGKAYTYRDPLLRRKDESPEQYLARLKRMFPRKSESKPKTFERTDDSMCPECNAPENHPTDHDAVLVRGCKVVDEDGNDWSQCLVCSGYYDPKTLAETPDNHNPEKGWFSE